MEGGTPSLGNRSRLVLLRILVGLVWLGESSLKLNSYYLGTGFGHEVAGVVGPGNPFPWYVWLIHHFVLNHAHLFALLKSLGELTIGLLLVLGFLTPLAAVGAIFLNLNFLLAAGWTGTDHLFINLLLAGSEAAFLAYGAGRTWGLDALMQSDTVKTREPEPALATLNWLVGAAWVAGAVELAHIGGGTFARRYLIGDQYLSVLRQVGVYLRLHPQAVYLLVGAQVVLAAAFFLGRGGWSIVVVGLLLASSLALATGWVDYLRYFYFLLLAGVGWVTNGRSIRTLRGALTACI